MPANRTKTGKFKAGQSGNPSGRPKRDARLKQAAREYTDEALETLVEIMRDETATPAAKVSAANSILDRGWGRPPQALVGGDEDDGPVRISVDFVTGE